MSNKSQNETELLTTVEFFEQLKQDKLDTPLSFGIIGMVKKSEGQGKTIEFAAGMKCSSWVTMPIELIENVEMIRTVPCKDHSHPLVKLNLKTPKTPEGKILFAILEGMKSPFEGMQQGIEANANEFGVPLSSRVSERFGTGYWGCSDTYCACDTAQDCLRLFVSGKCNGRRIICGRNVCVCFDRPPVK